MVDELLVPPMAPSIITKLWVIFFVVNWVSLATYGNFNSTAFTEPNRRGIRSPAFIENSQDFQGSVIFNTYFSSCVSSCSENDSECLGRCSNQDHGDRPPDPQSKFPTKDLSRIVGGKKAYRGENPSMVALWYYQMPFCGASIINNHYLLTAAHCVKDSTPDEFTIFTGLLNSNDNQGVHSKATKYQLTHIAIHEKYHKVSGGYDIAILRTRTPITFIPGQVEPAKLPKPGEDDCENATTWGWGSVTKYRGPTSDDLLKVDLPVVPYMKCFEKYGKKNIKIHEDLQVCYGFDSGGKDACSGDSGGPLTCTTTPNFQIGIVSYGIGCADERYPGVYTRVSKFLDWISSKTQS